MLYQRRKPKSMTTRIQEILKEHRTIINFMSYTVDIDYNPDTDEYDYYYELSFKDNLAGRTAYFKSNAKKIYECRASIAEQLKNYFSHEMYTKKPVKLEEKKVAK